MTTMTFAVLCGDDGGVSLLSYDWQHSVRIAGSAIAECGLFDETSHDFDYAADSEALTEILEMKMYRTGGWEPTLHAQLLNAVRKVCEPGPPHNGPIFVHLCRDDSITLSNGCSQLG